MTDERSERAVDYVADFQAYREVFAVLEQVLRSIEARTPAPQIVDTAAGPVYRYTERTVDQALVLKLACLVSHLNAMTVLLRSGMCQESGILFRCLDEISEFLMWLCPALQGQELDVKQKERLEEFYAEVFAEGQDPLASHRPARVPQKKIQSAITRQPCYPVNPSDGLRLQQKLSEHYSGFVHSSSAAAMNLYCDSSPGFMVSGMLDSPIHRSFMVQSAHYVSRAIRIFALHERFAGNHDIVSELRDLGMQFDARLGIDSAGDADTKIQEFRRKYSNQT